MAGRKPTSLQVRFWEKVDKRGSNECWNWTAGISANGYGSLRITPRWRTQAHKASWYIHYGTVPMNGKIAAKDDFCILHQCDNKLCVNPRHLRIGSRDENQKEMSQRGRVCRGERHVWSRMTETDVRKIRRLRAIGFSGNKIASRLGLGRAAVYSVIGGTTWRHVK